MHALTDRQDQPAERRRSRPLASAALPVQGPSPAAPFAAATLLHLQRFAGNRAVQGLLGQAGPIIAQRGCGCGSCSSCAPDEEAAVQRDEDLTPDTGAGGSEPQDRVAMCGGGVVTVAPIEVEEDDAGAVPSSADAVQRDGDRSDAVPMDNAKAAGGAAPACPVPADFSVFKDKPGGDGSGRAAGTPMGLNGFKNGHFVVTFDAASAWVDTDLVAKSPADGAKRLPQSSAA